MTEIDWRACAEAAEAERDQAVAEVRRLTHVGHDLAEEKLALNNRIAAVRALCDEWSRECITGGGSDVMAADLRAALAEPVEPQRRDDELAVLRRVVEIAAEYACPGPDGQDDIDRGRLLGAWFTEAREDIEHAARVGEAQPSACAKCGGRGFVPFKGRPSPEPTRPCPSCTRPKG